MGSAWRSEDEALLRRLEDERLVERLWAFESDGAAPLHPRAAGLIEGLRATDAGRRAITEVDVGAVARLIRPEPRSRLTPAMLHLLAVYEERLASACEGEPARWIAARNGALAAWLALVEQGEHLRRLGQAQWPQGGAEVALELWRRPLAELGAVARAEARSLGERGKWAMRALSRIAEACRVAGCTVELSRRVQTEADRRRTEAVEAALSVVGDAIADVTARGVAEQQGPKLAERLVAIWNWSDWDEHVERFAIDELTPMAWGVYQREPAYANLRAMIEPLEPLVDNLAQRVARDPTRMAYAAPVAQMFVFRSEMATTADEQREHAERAVRICPTHRNGRLILARRLAREVQASLEQGFVAAFESVELKAKLERARELYPRTKGLDELEERVNELGWWERWKRR